MEHQDEIRFSPAPVFNLSMAGIGEIAQWRNIKDAMRASFDFAVRKRDRYPEVISTLSEIPKGTISGLANGSDKSLRTHATRPRLMGAFDCMYLHQFEAKQLGGVFVRSIDYEQMEREIEQLKSHNDQLIAQLKQRGQNPVSPASQQGSRDDHGLFIAGGDA